MLYDRTYGVEVECFPPAFGPTHSDLARAVTEAGIACAYMGYTHAHTVDWKIVTDRSIKWAGSSGMLGVELVSPPLKGPEGFDQIRKVCSVLAAKQMMINGTCGLHVHVDARRPPLPLDAMKRLVLLYRQSEAIIDMVMPEARKGNNAVYCTSIATVSPRKVQAAIDNRALCYAVRGGSRNVKLNLDSLNRHGTVEFRHHSGTIDADKIIPWANMCLRLVDHAAMDPVITGVTAQATQRVIERVRRGTKIAIIYDLLTRSEGATMVEITAATGWNTISIPAFARTYGLTIRTNKTWANYVPGTRQKRVNRYFAVPAGAAAATTEGALQQVRQTTAARPRDLDELMTLLGVPDDEKAYWNERAAKHALAAAAITPAL